MTSKNKKSNANTKIYMHLDSLEIKANIDLLTLEISYNDVLFITLH